MVHGLIYSKKKCILFVWKDTCENFCNDSKKYFFFFINSRFSVLLINKLTWTYCISTAGYGYNYRLGIHSLARWPETIYSSRTPGVGHCTLYHKSEFWIPRNKTARPRSQFIHSCICERFIYSQDQSAYLAAAKQADRSWEYTYIERQNIILKFCFGKNEARQFHFWKYRNRNKTLILDSHRLFFAVYEWVGR
jgi:hypothetical protein